MFQLISALIGLIGTTGGKAIDKSTQVIVQEGLTSRAFIESGKQVAVSGWEDIAKGYSPSDAIALAISTKTLQEDANRRAKKAEEDKFKRNLWIIGICATALLVLIIVLKKK